MKSPVPVLLVVLVLCLLPLVLGMEALLVVELPGGLPLGTLLAALALVVGALVPFAASRPRSPLRWVGAVVLVAAVLWLPIGIHLAGNATLSFVDDAADSALFWRFTGGLAVLILVTMLWAAVAAVVRRRA